MQLSWKEAMTRADRMGLVWHGIQTENSHRRAHVCPQAGLVFVFPTRRGVEAIEAGSFGLTDVPRDGPPFCGLGCLVPPGEISECIALKPPQRVWDYFAFSEADTVTEKGDKAEALVLDLVGRGYFPLPVKVDCEKAQKGTDLQKSGRDITVKGVELALEEAGVEVKCDWPVGGKSKRLFLQIAESNPNGHH